ncbi:MAG: hypothetical protein LQ342_004199 [Letrouitia transgressa]|nr:MAG: hypothetical protein LQ342_004199 [Letrouitia transgressa]
MWNDEDNNPYGSFDRRDLSSPEPPSGKPDHHEFDQPSTPPSGTSSPSKEPPEFVSRPQDLSDDDDDDHDPRRSSHLPRKKATYDSRIEQLLCENPDLQIIITDAGKSHESGGSYIVYTIRTGVWQDERQITPLKLLMSHRTWRFEDDTLNSAP